MIWSSQFHNKYIAKHRNLYSIIFSWTKVVRYIAWLDLTKVFSEWAWVGYYPWQQCSPIIPSSASWSSSVRTLSEQCILHWSGLDCPVQINQAQLPLPPHPLHRFPPPSTLAKNHPDHLQSYISWSTRFGIFQRLSADKIFDFFFAIEFQSMDINFILPPPWSDSSQPWLQCIIWLQVQKVPPEQKPDAGAFRLAMPCHAEDWKWPNCLQLYNVCTWHVGCKGAPFKVYFTGFHLS